MTAKITKDVYREADAHTRRVFESTQIFHDSVYQAKSDEFNPELDLILVAPDYSLVHPIISQKAIQRPYDRVGRNIFSLFDTYGRLTRYRLILTSGAHDEMLSRLKRRHDILNIASTQDPNQLGELLNTGFLKKELNQILSSSPSDNRGLKLQISLIEKGLLIGSASKFGELDISSSTSEAVFRDIENKLDSRNKPIFNATCDKRVVYDIVRYGDAIASQPLVYSGEEEMVYAVGNTLPRHVRDPITLLVKLYSFYQSSPELDIKVQSNRFIQKTLDAYSEIIEILNFYKRIESVNSREINIIKNLREEYHHPLFGNLASYDYEREHMTKKQKYADLTKEFSSSEFKNNVDHEISGNQEKVQKVSEIIDKEWDERLYGKVDSLSTERFLKRREMVHRHFKI